MFDEKNKQFGRLLTKTLNARAADLLNATEIDKITLLLLEWTLCYKWSLLPGVLHYELVVNLAKVFAFFLNESFRPYFLISSIVSFRYFTFTLNERFTHKQFTFFLISRILSLISQIFIVQNSTHLSSVKNKPILFEHL